MFVQFCGHQISPKFRHFGDAKMDTVSHNSLVWGQILSVIFQDAYLHRNMEWVGSQLLVIFQWHTELAKACEELSRQHFSTLLIARIFE